MNVDSNTKAHISRGTFTDIWSGEYEKYGSFAVYYIRDDHSNILYVQFKNCIIDAIAVNATKTYYPIKLIDCEIGEVDILKASANSITFNGCQIGNISFGDVKLDRIDISESQLKSITFDKCAVGSNQIINSLAEDLRLYNSNFHSIIVGQGSTVKSIVADKCTIAKLMIDELVKLGYIYIGDSTLNTLSITNATTWHINIVNSISKALFIENSTTGSFQIHSNSSISSIYFDSSTNGDWNIKDTDLGIVSIKKSRINSIHLNYLKNESKRLVIEDSLLCHFNAHLDKPYQVTVRRGTINHLNFTDTVLTKEVYLNFSDTEINAITINSFLNLGIVVFNNIKPVNSVEFFTVERNGNPRVDKENQYSFDRESRHSELNILNSDLGKMQFIGCNLRKYDRFIFLNSKMLDVFVADTQLPTRKEIKTIPDRKNYDDSLEQQRLALSQFKKIYENMGDMLRSTQYLAEELETYRQHEKNEKFRFLSNGWFNNTGETINLGMNRISSFYGNNWLRGVFTTLCVTAGFYILYCLTRGIYPADPFYVSNWQNFWNLFPYYFEFLNPVRKTDFFEHIKPEYPNPGALTIDYVSRIFIAYFVYQTIQAFRKFGKKS